MISEATNPSFKTATGSRFKQQQVNTDSILNPAVGKTKKKQGRKQLAVHLRGRWLLFRIKNASLDPHPSVVGVKQFQPVFHQRTVSL